MQVLSSNVHSCYNALIDLLVGSNPDRLTFISTNSEQSL